jgi:hypothetical protein
MEVEMRLRGATLTAAILVATMFRMPANAETFIPLHRGINLSVAPGGADHSSVPIAAQRTENEQRVAEAADIGFDFIRLRVPLAPWTDTGSEADQQEALMPAGGIIEQALSKGMRVDVVMMAGSLSTTTASGLICTANPAAVAAWTAGWRAVLALLPDTFHVAFEPLNEPPDCPDGYKVWDNAQVSLYHRVRALRHAVKFVVYGNHWGDDIGTDFASLDPTPYLDERQRSIHIPLLRPLRIHRSGACLASRWPLPISDRGDMALQCGERASLAEQRSWARQPGP